MCFKYKTLKGWACIDVSGDVADIASPKATNQP